MGQILVVRLATNTAFQGKKKNTCHECRITIEIKLNTSRKLINGWLVLTSSIKIQTVNSLDSLSLIMSLNNFELPGNLVAFGHLASGSETENWKSDFNPINMVFIGKLIGRSHAVKIEYESYCMTHTICSMHD